jgi:hypothetical protein
MRFNPHYAGPGAQRQLLGGRSAFLSNKSHAFNCNSWVHSSQAICRYAGVVWVTSCVCEL